jgi:hypothetical protein
MRYKTIADEPDCVIWRDEDGNSGIIRQGDEGWADYELFLNTGHVPDTAVTVDSRTIEELRSHALLMINLQADNALAPITSQYARSEIDSWPQQCAEVNAWLVDHQADTPLIDAIMGSTSTADKQAFCEGVLDKANTYKRSVGAVINWRRAASAWAEVQQEREALLGFSPQFPEVPNAS